VRQHRGILLSGRGFVWIAQRHSRDGPRMVIVLKTSLPLNSVITSLNILFRNPPTSKANTTVLWCLMSHLRVREQSLSQEPEAH
jgi:hypothetical protein